MTAVSIKHSLSKFENFSDAPELDGKYEILSEIGFGTYGCVYKARFLSTNALVAIKRVKCCASENGSNDFAEAAILKNLGGSKKSYIPRCYNICLDRQTGAHSIVMQYFDNCVSFNGYAFELSVNQIRHFFKCLFRSLDALHTFGFVHRDLKPANILFNPQSGLFRLIDFGLAQKKSDLQSFHSKDSQSIKRTIHSNNYPFNQNSDEKCDTESDSEMDNLWLWLGKGMTDANGRERKHPTTHRRGTPGIRAPEILLRSNNQSGKIDTYAAGLILLSIMVRSYPCFEPIDDSHALMLLIAIHGWLPMAGVAATLQKRIELRQLSLRKLPTLNCGDKMSAFVRMYRTRNEFKVDNCKPTPEMETLLDGLLCLNPKHRFSAKDALNHPFFH